MHEPRTLRTKPYLATSRARVRTLNATPEPLRKGRSATVTARVQLRNPRGVWYSSAFPALVRFEFKAKGKKRYRSVAVAATPAGVAQIRYNPKKSGRWRAFVLQANGSWTKSKVDYVRLRK